MKTLAFILAALLIGFSIFGVLLFASLGREMREENRRWKRNLYETNRD